MDFEEKRKLYPQYGRTMPFYKRGKGLEINTMELDGDLEIAAANQYPNLRILTVPYMNGSKARNNFSSSMLKSPFYVSFSKFLT